MAQERTAVLRVEGMSCQHCKNSVEKALRTVDGVVAATVDLDAKTVTVVYDPTKATPEEFKNSIANAGYQAREE